MVLHNPNNWHWVDKNCLAWSRNYFKEKVVGIGAKEGNVEARITSLSSLEGDVDVCQRKGKVISLFDVNMEYSFEGKVGDVEATGRIKIPEVAYDTQEDEYQFTISINNESNELEPLKSLVRQKLVPQLRIILSNFSHDLIATHGKQIQHEEAVKPAERLEHVSSSQSDSHVKGTSTYNVVRLTLNPAFTASAEQLYNALTDPQLVEIWTRSRPELSREVGSSYSLFGGNITGKIQTLEPNKRIVVTWRLKSWKPEHYATINFSFQQRSTDTVMNVEWDGIPVGQEEVVKSNFTEYYVNPIMMSFGYGLP